METDQRTALRQPGGIMTFTTRRHRALSAFAGLVLLSGVVVFTESPAGAVTCPVVDPLDHHVTPAPAPSVNWTGCNLTDANLTNADLTGSNLHTTIFTGATLTGATLSGADMTAANLRKAKMANSVLNGTNLVGATFTGVSSGGITGNPSLSSDWHLIHGYLIGRGANLIGAELVGQNLKPANIEDADLTGANLSSANLQSITATHANLTNANLTSTILTSTNLRYAILKGATVTSSTMNGTQLEHAILEGVASGGIIGTAASLPEGWRQGAGFLLYGLGLLRVTTTPAVPARIYVDGFLRDTWGLQWVKVPTGSHEVCFGSVAAFDTPDCQTVTVNLNATTTVNGTYTQRGYLHVSTNPPLASQISIDGTPRDNWGVYTDVPVGTHVVCFGSLEGLTPPPCETVEVNAGGTTNYTGTFTPSSVGPVTDVGYLRVTTEPAVPSQISIDGLYRDTWGLNWLAIDPGEHQVCWNDVAGYTRPDCQTVSVTDGNTTEAVGTFTQRGYLKVETNPAMPTTVYMDGYPMDDWGVYTDVTAASHYICFGDAATYIVPSCADHPVPAGTTTVITGNYTTYPWPAPGSG